MVLLAKFQVFFLFIYFQAHPRKFSPLSFLDLLEEMRSGWRCISIRAHVGGRGEAGRRVGIAGGCKYIIIIIIITGKTEIWSREVERKRLD